MNPIRIMLLLLIVYGPPTSAAESTWVRCTSPNGMSSKIQRGKCSSPTDVQTSVAVVVGTNPSLQRPAVETVKASALAEARKSFKTTIRPQVLTHQSMPKAPELIFRNVKYLAPVGDLGAYVTPSRNDGKKYPAIIWITGGDCNSLSDVWTQADRLNDQSASAYRKLGIVMMFPSLRGGNENPGTKEGFYGEIQDVLAALDYLEKLDYVDQKRIYLGGHSTGGTLALLVAEYSNRFRAIFSFGPVSNVLSYRSQPSYIPIDILDSKEVELRSPIFWLSSVQSPTWVFEGTGGNIGPFREMAMASKSKIIRFMEVKGANHFSILAPMNELIAKKILEDKNPKLEMSYSYSELNALFK